MTICGTCQGVMSAANRRLKTEAGILDRINALLAPEGWPTTAGPSQHLLLDCGARHWAARLGALVSSHADFASVPFFTVATSSSVVGSRI